MNLNYNEKYYHDGALHSLKPKARAINTWKTKDGVIIGMFQGSRGSRPDLDYIVKILKPGEEMKPFPPIHTLWVVDLILKIEKYRTEVKEIIEYYIDFYHRVEPFETIEDRNRYKLITVDLITNKYHHIEQEHTLSLEYVSTIIELFCLNEKRNKGAYMFIGLLNTLLSYVNRKADYIDVIIAAQPGYR